MAGIAASGKTKLRNYAFDKPDGVLYRVPSSIAEGKYCAKNTSSRCVRASRDASLSTTLTSGDPARRSKSRRNFSRNAEKSQCTCGSKLRSEHTSELQSRQ